MTTENDTDISELAAQSTDEIPPPPPPEPGSPKTKREERSQRSIMELLLDLHDRLDGYEDWQRDVDAWRSKVDCRLDEGDKVFKRIEENVAIAMNAMVDLCDVRSLEQKTLRAHDKLDGHRDQMVTALNGYTERRERAHPSVHDEPTNPTGFPPPAPPGESSAPPPPQNAE